MLDDCFWLMFEISRNFTEEMIVFERTQCKFHTELSEEVLLELYTIVLMNLYTELLTEELPRGSNKKKLPISSNT